MLSFSPGVRITRTGEIGLGKTGCGRIQNEMKYILPSFPQKTVSALAVARRFLPAD